MTRPRVEASKSATVEPGPPTHAQGPNVAMMVFNDITTDSRVKKTAATVTALGATVTLIGRSSTVRHEGYIGPIRTVWVEVGTMFASIATVRRHSVLKGRYGRRRWSLDDVRWSTRMSTERYVQERTRLKLSLRLLESADDIARRGPNDHRLRRRGRRLQHSLIARRVRRLDRQLERSRDLLKRSTTEASLIDERRFHERQRQQLLGRLDDWEMAFGGELDVLQPDVVHVHDVHLLATAIRFKIRQRHRGRFVAVIYDAHEFVAGSAHTTGDSNAIYRDVERRSIPHVDRIITVSPTIQRWLSASTSAGDREVFLVLNAPPLLPAVDPEMRTIRSTVGLPKDTPLAVYSGGISEVRGVFDLVSALPKVPNLHLAIIAPTNHRLIDRLIASAEDLQVSDRLHIAPYVNSGQVSCYLRDADVGVHPLHRTIDLDDGSSAIIDNHDAALPNKLFEYLHARLPVVVSNCTEMSSFVHENGVGTTFRSGDIAALAEALTQAYRERSTHRENITDELLHRFSWQSQLTSLAKCYQGLPGFDRPIDVTAASREHDRLLQQTTADL